tara:strand:- start:283 stop:393 length:111 start_codon:yes stop_codon:yes gene_type:complete
VLGIGARMRGQRGEIDKKSFYYAKINESLYPKEIYK